MYKRQAIPYLHFGIDGNFYGPARFTSRQDAVAYFQDPEYLTAKKIILSLEGLSAAEPARSPVTAL